MLEWDVVSKSLGFWRSLQQNMRHMLRFYDKSTTSAWRSWLLLYCCLEAMSEIIWKGLLYEWWKKIQKRIYHCVSSAAPVIRARIGCRRHRFIQNGPEHRVVTRRGRISIVSESCSGSNNGMRCMNCYVCDTWPIQGDQMNVAMTCRQHWRTATRTLNLLWPR